MLKGAAQWIRPAGIAALLLSLTFLFVSPVLAGGEEGTSASTAPLPPQRLIVAWDEGTVFQAGSPAAPDPDSSSEGPRAELRELQKDWPGLDEELASAAWIAPDTQVLELPAGLSPEQARGLFESLENVRLAEPDAFAGINVYSTDPYYQKQWFLPHVGADEAWGLELGSPDVVVAVVDTGVDASHPDLAGRVLAGYDFVNSDNSPGDDHGHGTHVAGIIAASGDNGVGVAGMAWRASILPVKVLDSQGSGYYSDVIAGIRYAADVGAEVINLSLSGGASSTLLQEAVDYARSRDAVVVAAAGNDALDTLGYPAACGGVTSVGAVDDDDICATFSNRGEGLDLTAPGIGVYSDYRGGGYASMSGTSMAAPQVAGAAALLRSLHPGWGVDQVEGRLYSTARDLNATGYDTDTGWGLLQAQAAMGWTEPVAEAGGPQFFAEGYTGPGFDTYTLLENPGGDVARAELCFYGPQGPSSSLDVEVPPRSRLTLHLNELVPAGDVSCGISLPEGSPVRAQRSMYFRYGDLGGGHTSFPSAPSATWYFAEGYTGEGFDTYLLIFNPEAEEARVDIDWMTPGSSSTHSLTVPPLSRRTVLVDDYLPGCEVATSISADHPIVAERSMYFDSSGRTGGSCTAGAPALGEDWFFAEGYTGGDFDEWILLLNPEDQEVDGSVSFLRSDGLLVDLELLLAPRSRYTIHVDEVPGLRDAEVYASISMNSPGVVAERAMYFSTQTSSGPVDGGHATLGYTQPGDRWLLPEGYTGAGFESWILVANLEDYEVSVHVSLFGENGEVAERDFRVMPQSRFTMKENDLLAGQGISAEVSAAPGTRLVVEGAYYFRLSGGIDDGSS